MSLSEPAGDSQDLATEPSEAEMKVVYERHVPCLLMSFEAYKNEAEPPEDDGFVEEVSLAMSNPQEPCVFVSLIGCS